MRKLPTVLSPDEAEALLRQPNLRAVTGLRNRAMLEIMLWAGLRVSEVCDLRNRDVRWNANRIEVRQGKGAKDRVVPMTPGLAAMLRQWHERRPDSEFFFCTGCTRGGVAVGNAAGARVTPRYIQIMVKRLATRAGIERNVTPHTLRHTAATTWLDRGFTIREVQQLCGHASVQTTQIYTHVSDVAIATKMAAFA